MKRKLTSNRGESMVETLTALLICTLSIMLLAGGLTAASRINDANDEADAQFNADLSVAESHTGTPEVKEVTFTYKHDGSIKTYTADIDVYGNDRFASYQKGSVGP